jgi:hypothetical protein
MNAVPQGVIRVKYRSARIVGPSSQGYDVRGILANTNTHDASGVRRALLCLWSDEMLRHFPLAVTLLGFASALANYRARKIKRGVADTLVEVTVQAMEVGDGSK